MTDHFSPTPIPTNEEERYESMSVLEAVTAPEPTPELPVPVPDVQAALNELVWQHGQNLELRPDFEQLLQAAGLERAMVRKRMIREAEKAAAKRLKEETSKPLSPEEVRNPWDKLIWNPVPIEETWTTGKVWKWATEGGDYRVFRFGTPEGEEYAAEYRTPEGSWDIFESGKKGPTYPLYVTSLELALIAVEKFHSERYQLEASSNREEVLEEERKARPQLALPVIPSEKVVASPGPKASGVAGKKGKWDDVILSVLSETEDTSPVQIKKKAGIPKLNPATNKPNMIFGTLKRLMKEGKILGTYGKYRLAPTTAKAQTQEIDGEKEVQGQGESTSGGSAEASGGPKTPSPDGTTTAPL